mmetsp:Transcript_27053/g.56653  ORF Transcript_27053/g.56653 Transcript_27053/m.56653 type:complete len:225 (-) Transcript_27053:575-1249(-)
MDHHDWTIDVFNPINIGINIQASQSSAGCQYAHSTGKGAVQNHTSNLLFLGGEKAAGPTSDRLSVQDDIPRLFVGHFFQCILINRLDICICVVFVRDAAAFPITGIVINHYMAFQRQRQNDLNGEHGSNIGGISVTVNDCFCIFRYLRVRKSVYQRGNESPIALGVTRNLDGLNGILVMGRKNQSIVQGQSVSDTGCHILLVSHLAHLGALPSFFRLLRQLFHG